MRGTNTDKYTKKKQANSFCIATEKYLFSVHVLKYLQNI